MYLGMSFGELGAWITTSYKVMKEYNLNEAVFDPYEATILAAKAGLLLSPVRRLDRIEQEQFDVFRSLSGLKPMESVVVLKNLKALDYLQVEWDPAGSQESPVKAVKAVAKTKMQVLEAIGELFVELNPSAVAKASLAALHGTLHLPIPQDQLVSSLVTAGLNERDVKKAIEHLVSISLLSRTLDQESGSPLLFNPMVFKKNAQDVFSAINGLGTNQRQNALDVIQWVKDNPGIPIPDRYPKEVIDLLVSCGLIDVSVISVVGGTVNQAFPTMPALWAAQGVNELGGDIVDDAKALLNSFRFGEIFSTSGRGKIFDPEILVDRLISRGQVGPCTAIGQDYPLPLARGIVSIVESRIKPGQFHMELRKVDVAEAVRDVFAHKGFVPQPIQDDDVLRRLKQHGQFVSPETFRVKNALPVQLQEERDSLAFQLRTYRKGR